MVVNLDSPGRQLCDHRSRWRWPLIATSKSALKAVTMIFMMFS